MPFVWNNLDKQGVSMLTGDSPARQKIAEAMHAAWITFARNGNPNTQLVPEWPVYNTDHRATLIFNEEYALINDPQAAERQLWKSTF